MREGPRENAMGGRCVGAERYGQGIRNVRSGWKVRVWINVREP